MSEPRRFELPGGPQAPMAARLAVDGLDGLVDHVPGDELRLLVSELVNNCVTHASIGEDEELTLEVAPLERGVRVEVVDPGPGFAISPRALESDDESGWGLFLVEALADRWGVSRDGGCTRVWFELDAPAGASGA